MVEHVVLVGLGAADLMVRLVGKYGGYHVVGYQISSDGNHYVVLERVSELDDPVMLHRRVNALALRMQRAAAILGEIISEPVPYPDQTRMIQRALGELTEEAT